MIDIAWLCSAILTATFAWAALAKILRFRPWLEALAAYRVPVPIGRIASIAVPVAELAIAVLFLVGAARAGASLALGLLSIFSAVVVRSALQGRKRLPCGCFGRTKERDPRAMVARNALLAAAVVAVLIAGRDVSLFRDVALPRASELTPIALILTGVVIGTWLVWNTTRSFRRRGR